MPVAPVLIRIMESMDREERIRHRAFALWEAEGRPEGRHLAHWQQAERELVEEEQPADPVHEVMASLDDPDANRSLDGLPAESPLAGLGQPKLSDVS